MSPSSQLTTPKQTTSSELLSLNHWVSDLLNLPNVRVQCWQRDHAIDILCEGETCPEVSRAIDPLTEGLTNTNIQTLLPPDSPEILIVCVHGRTAGKKRPNWTVRLNPRDPHTATPPRKADGVESQQNPDRNNQYQISETLQSARPNVSPDGASPKAIANYLRQTLKSWGLGVKVIVKIQTLEKPTSQESEPIAPTSQTEPESLTNPWGTPKLNAEMMGESSHSSDSNDRLPISNPPQKRLWVVCKSAYSPEPLSIAAPLGSRLRQLDLQGFKDAVILGQVSGEKQPEWIFRVDLTPAKEMLENWARWGDVQAVTKLLHQQLIETLPERFAEELQVSGVLKESTLHIFISNPAMAVDRPAYGDESNVFHKEMVKDAIAPLLESMAPQNIYGITIYGLRGDRATVPDPEATPLWVDWLDLPASRHANLAPTTMELASAGNLDALSFLIDRLLNPDLEQKLNTGGIRVAIRHKADLLHIMVDAAICPVRRVGGKVAKFIASLNIPEIAGVRVYGRRSGQKQSSWRVGIDFQSRESRIDATPEFSVSEPVSHSASPDLLPDPGNLIVRPDVNSEDLQACLTTVPTAKLRKKKQEPPNALKQALMLSGIFIPASSARDNNLTGAKVTIIWGLLGLLFTLQMDWLLGELIQLRQYQVEQSTVVSTSDSSRQSEQSTRQVAEQTMGDRRDSADSKSSKEDDKNQVFNSSGFTQSLAVESKPLPANSVETLDYPSFNSQQMDEQLALYAQYVETYGVPDILIVGSSRALRGIDPTVLRRELADRYSNLRLFNFGVNGATAQVVDWMVRQLIGTNQLPRLIVWADGARAFNSGRSDRTFEAIEASDGYQELKLGLRPPIAVPESDSDKEKSDDRLTSLTVTIADRAQQGFSVADAYQQLDQWLNEKLGSVSASYPQRNELHTWFSESVSHSLDFLENSAEECLPQTQEPGSACQLDSDLADNSLESIITEDLKSPMEIDGFLPINIQFDPSSYYEQYAFVSGDYDADYESFNLTGEQTVAMNNLLGFLQVHQVSLVFVNMPLTEDYLDPIRRKHERTFQQYTIALALQYGFIFRDFSQEWSNDYNYFSDPSHLNYLGAQRVSERLAQDPLIPWPNNQSSQ